MFTRLRAFLPLALAALAGPFVHAAPAGPPSQVENPDFTRGETVPEGATHDWNLGPTGARGWMYSNRLETSEARQVLAYRDEARTLLPFRADQAMAGSGSGSADGASPR